MKVGIVVGEGVPHPLLFQTNQPTFDDVQQFLIVGWENVLTFFPKQQFHQKQIAHNIQWCFSQHDMNLEYEQKAINDFAKYCVAKIIGEYSVVNVFDLNKLELTNEWGFISEYSNQIIITQNKKIFIINFDIMEFLYGSDWNNQLDKLSDYNLLCDKSETVFRDIRPILKHNLSDFKWNIFKHKLASVVSPSLYEGVFYLCQLNEIDQTELITPTKGEKVWKRAFEMEDYLSGIPIRIDDTIQKEVVASIVDGSKNGIVYQKYNGTDKTTGRMFCYGGYSVQTIAKENRSIILPLTDSSILVEFDYQYFEFNLLFQLCNVQTDHDPHSYTSQLLFGDVDHRSFCKTINYGLLYGKSMNAIKRELTEQHISDEVFAKLEKEFQPMFQFGEQLLHQFRTNGFITNEFGRRVIPTSEGSVLNTFIQSTAADFLIYKLTSIRRFLKKGNVDQKTNSIILQNHDSVLFSISDVELIKPIKEILEQPIKQAQNLFGKVSCKTGKNWQILKNCDI